MSAIPQMSESESKFFESGGQEVAESLREPAPTAEPMEEARAGETEPRERQAEEAETGAAAADAAPSRAEGRFVPLQALQEERAEKKQLREELRQYREWQSQLARRLQQMPAAQAPQMPDPQTRPLDYINHVLGNMQNTTAELQQWRQQQEAAARQQTAVQQALDWVDEQGRDYAQTQPDYDEAYRYAEEARDKEPKAIGCGPSQRAAIVRANRMEIINNALQLGKNPAELIWDYARARGSYQRAAARAATPKPRRRLRQACRRRVGSCIREEQLGKWTYQQRFLMTARKGSGFYQWRLSTRMFSVIGGFVLFLVVLHLVDPAAGDSWLQTVLELWKSYGYPHALTAIVVFVVLFLRQPLRSWMNRLNALTVQGVRAEFSPQNTGLKIKAGFASELWSTGSPAAEEERPVVTGAAVVPAAGPRADISDLSAIGKANPPIADVINHQYYRDQVVTFKAGVIKHLKPTPDQLTDILAFAAVEAAIEADFERIHRAIFRSQSSALRLAMDNPGKQIPMELARTTFDETSSRNREVFAKSEMGFPQWLDFLIGQGLCSIEVDSAIKVTTKGELYWSYISKRGYDLDGSPGGLVL